MMYEKIVGETPSGGDYSEIYYLDDDGNAAEADKATRCMIRECKADGTLLNEIYGRCNDEIRFDKARKTYEDHFGQTYGILMHDRRSLDEHIKIMEQALEDDKPVQNPAPPHDYCV